jgi:hypothetical protein
MEVYVMTINRMPRFAVMLTIICLIAGSSALAAGQSEGKATPKKMNGTWSSIVTVPPNDILGNEDDLDLPELDTFSTAGTAITSAAASVLPLDLDQGFHLAAVGLGQGNWKFVGRHRFVMTQWRFLTDTNSGEPFGYIKVIAEWTLVNRNLAAGEYEVQILALDMMTPFTSDGTPAAVSGPFTMWRLPIERLP